MNQILDFLSGAPQMAAAMVVLRIVSEALLHIAGVTDAKWDNKVARLFSMAVDAVGTVAGMLGVGMPKKMRNR